VTVENQNYYEVKQPLLYITYQDVVTSHHDIIIIQLYMMGVDISHTQKKIII